MRQNGVGIWKWDAKGGRLSAMTGTIESPVFRIDPELRDLLPRLAAPERLLLKRQIRAEGRLLSPLIVWAEGGVLIDGHHRSQILEELQAEGVEVETPPIAFKSFRSRYSVIRWMIQHQNARRNWTPVERAAAVLQNRELLNRLRSEAKARQRSGKRSDPQTRGSAGDTRRALARLAGVGEGTLARVQFVLNSGDEEVIHKLLMGRKLSAREAKRMVIRREERRKLAAQAVAACFQRHDMGTHQEGELICADVLDGLKLVQSESVSLAFTSPPYPLTTMRYERFQYDGQYDHHIAWLKSVWIEVARTLRRGGRLLINVDSVGDEFGSNTGDIVRPVYADTLMAAKEAGLNFMGDICWFKNHVTGKRAYWGTYASCRSPRLRRNHEYILAFYKESPVLDGDPAKCDLAPEEFEEWTMGHWKIPPEKRSVVPHPAPFPVALATRVIKLFSYVGDLVLDPFCGSGTVPVAATQLGRRFVGIDNGPSYIALARERVQSVLTGNQPEAPQPDYASDTSYDCAPLRTK
jgi:DNA modification methylase